MPANLILARTVRKSLCPCGHPILREDVPLGTEYQLDMERTNWGTMVCGGCQARRPLLCVWVHPEGYLPLDIFELGEG